MIVSDFKKWLEEYNSKFAALTHAKKIQFLRDFTGSQKTTERERKEIQIQIDKMESKHDN